ncbi:MAG: hypothetical protein IPF57_14225 [Gammaproteobacteria bacterium]|nr:hypothetical protein [Gammaproteobacteria bacterium]
MRERRLPDGLREAERVVAAPPFRVRGGTGVVAQIPNFHRLSQKHVVDYEMVTTGNTSAP